MVRAGYFLQWHVVSLLKEMGPVRWYDLHGGLDTPGVRRFKRGIVGAKPKEASMIEFQATRNAYCAWLLNFATNMHKARLYLRKRCGENAALDVPIGANVRFGSQADIPRSFPKSRL